MPVFNYHCNGCQGEFKRVLRAAEAVQGLACKVCGEAMERLVGSPTTQVVESLDNGSMVRKLERLADAERLFDERARGKPTI